MWISARRAGQRTQYGIRGASVDGICRTSVPVLSNFSLTDTRVDHGVREIAVGVLLLGNRSR